MREPGLLKSIREMSELLGVELPDDFGEEESSTSKTMIDMSFAVAEAMQRAIESGDEVTDNHRNMVYLMQLISLDAAQRTVVKNMIELAIESGLSSDGVPIRLPESKGRWRTF